MKVALIGNYENKPRMQAFADSLGAKGMEPEKVTCPRKTNPEEYLFAYTCGWRMNDKRLRMAFHQARKSIVVLDLGYLHRANKRDHSGYHQVGLDRIGWLPKKQTPSDRFDSLNIQILPQSPNLPDGDLLILGQLPGDSQHPFQNIRAMSCWFQARIGKIKQTYSRIVYRTHPEAIDHYQNNYLPEEWIHESPVDVELEEAIAKASIVLTYNSTAGVEAIRQGKQVVCDSEAHYALVRNAELVDRRDYFHRLAYAQWSLAEIQAGDALTFILNQLAIE